jgi:hypothetical protein
MNENAAKAESADEVASALEVVTVATTLENARSSAAVVACFDKALATLAYLHPKADHRALARELLEDAHGRRERASKKG